MNFSPFPCVSSVQFSSVQYERCWLGLVIPSAARMAARGPPLTSFGVMAFWPDKGRQGGDGGWRSGGKQGRGAEGLY